MALTANPVVWFEIPVTNISRAKQFYEAAFAVELTESEMDGTKMAWFPMEMNATGATGTLVQGDGFTPSREGTLVYLQAGAIDAVLASIVAAGGKTLVPRTDIGQHGCFAHFEDSEGNRVGLHEAASGS